MSQPDRVEIAMFRGAGTVGATAVAGRSLEQCEPPTPALYVDWQPRGLASVFAAIKRLIRPLVVLLYLAPLLVVLKLVFYLADIPGGHWITVGFVALTLGFFVLLALLVLLFPLVGPRSARRLYPVLHTDAHALEPVMELLDLPRIPLATAEQLDRLCRTGEPGPLSIDLRVRGTARRASGADGGALITDRWVGQEGCVARLLLSRPLSLEQDGPPLVVDPGEGAWLLLRYRRGEPTRLELSEPTPRDHVARWLAEQGDNLTSLETFFGDDAVAGEVLEGAGLEVVCAGGVRVVENIDELSLAGRPLQLRRDAPGGAPYRIDRTRRGLLLTGTHEAPLVIRLVQDPN